jgi:hypothetical protein
LTSNPATDKRPSDTVDLLTLCTPGGAEKFFRAAGHDLRDPKPDNWALTPAAMAQAAAIAGQTFLGPPKADA